MRHEHEEGNAGAGAENDGRANDEQKFGEVVDHGDEGSGWGLWRLGGSRFKKPAKRKSLLVHIVHLPKSSSGERMTGTGFQVPFEYLRLSLVRKRDIGHQSPRGVFGRVGRLSGIMLCESLF
jgi:hypothetical protein